MRIFVLGLILGAAIILAIDQFGDNCFNYPADDVDEAQEARRYEATRACIQRSDCKMTVEDWIDYYELKYQLEQKVDNVHPTKRRSE